MRELPTGRLNKKVVTVWRIRSLIESALIGLFLIGGFLIWHFADPQTLGWIWVLLAVAFTAAYLIIFAIIIPNFNYIRWRYVVNDEEIDIVKGVFFRKRIIIPLVRVQHVDSKQGPLLRAFGLASVSVATAAGEHEIPGLILDEADMLRDTVAKLARMAQEDV